MQKIEMCRKITQLGKMGQCTLIYFIVEDNTDFGVGIKIAESEEEVLIPSLTRSEARVKRLCDVLASNFVTPVALHDVVQDWLCTYQTGKV